MNGRIQRNNKQTKIIIHSWITDIYALIKKEMKIRRNVQDARIKNIRLYNFIIFNQLSSN